jgi:hypothetical protein
MPSDSFGRRLAGLKRPFAEAGDKCGDQGIPGLIDEIRKLCGSGFHGKVP